MKRIYGALRTTDFVAWKGSTNHATWCRRRVACECGKVPQRNRFSGEEAGFDGTGQEECRPTGSDTGDPAASRSGVSRATGHYESLWRDALALIGMGCSSTERRGSNLSSLCSHACEGSSPGENHTTRCAASRRDLPVPGKLAYPEEQTQPKRNHRFNRAHDGHLGAAVEPGAARDQGFGRANRKVRRQADPCRDQDGEIAAQEKEGNDRDKRAQAGGDAGGKRLQRRVGERLFRETQFLVRQGAQKLLRALREPLRQQFGLFLVEAFQLIKEREFFAFLFGVGLDLALLPLEFRLVDFALALGRQIRAGPHRERACQHPRQPRDQDRAAPAGIARHAADNAKDRAQSIIRAIDCLPQPAPAALVPAFAVQQNIQPTLRACRFNHLPNDIAVALFLALHLVQQGGRRLVIQCPRLRFIARRHAIFLGLHPAQRGIGPRLPVQPVSELLAPPAPQFRQRRAQFGQLFFPTRGVTPFRLCQALQHALAPWIMLAGGQFPIDALALFLAPPAFLKKRDKLLCCRSGGTLNRHACPSVYYKQHWHSHKRERTHASAALCNRMLSAFKSLFVTLYPAFRPKCQGLFLCFNQGASWPHQPVY